MTTLLNGPIGGLIAGLGETLAPGIADGDRPAASELLGELFGEEARSARPWRVAFLVLYGTIGSLHLVALELFALGAVGTPPSPLEAYDLAVGWGIVMLVVFPVYRGLGLQFYRDALVDLLVFLAVFGFGLGIWIRTPWIARASVAAEPAANSPTRGVRSTVLGGPA